MSQLTAQVKLNLPLQLKALLETKAGKLGFSLPTYIKFLAANDVQDEEYPVLQDWQIEEIKKGLVEAESGDFATDEEVNTVFEKYS